MECLKQFNFSINTGKTFTAASGVFVPWVVGTNNSWLIKSSLDSSDFTIQGFKNINLYGIKFRGSIQSPISGNKGIVNDYQFQIRLTGQTPSISGVFTLNNWNASLYDNDVRLGKYQNEIMFSEPIRSLSQIKINFFTAQGFNNDSIVDIRLDLICQFYFLFKYESEDDNLLY